MSASERGGSGPVRIDRILDDLIERRGMRARLERTTVLDAWPSLVGEAIAGVTRARAVEDSTLFVEVRSSAWLMELDLRKRDILRRLNEGRDASRIERIVFVLGEAGW